MYDAEYMDEPEQCCNGWPEGSCPVNWDCPSAPAHVQRRALPGQDEEVPSNRTWTEAQVVSLGFWRYLFETGRVGGPSDGADQYPEWAGAGSPQ